MQIPLRPRCKRGRAKQIIAINNLYPNIISQIFNIINDYWINHLKSERMNYICNCFNMQSGNDKIAVSNFNGIYYGKVSRSKEVGKDVSVL